MDHLESAIVFLLRHVVLSGDGPTSQQARKHLVAVERVLAAALAAPDAPAAPASAPAPEPIYPSPNPSGIDMATSVSE